MAQIPTPLRAALGLVANAIEGARTLPDKAVELPVLAVSTALQFSLRAQQRYAEFALRGDELIGRLRGLPEEPPSWATFDDDGEADEASADADDGEADADAEEDAEDAADPGVITADADALPAAIPIGHPEPNATVSHGPAADGTDSPDQVKSATKQPRSRKVATAQKARAGKATEERVDAKTAAPGRKSKPSAFDEVGEHDTPADHARPETSQG